MSKFYTVTDLISAESSNFEEDVKNNIKEKTKNKECFKVFSSEEDAQRYADKITPTNYWLGNPAVVSVNIAEEVWAGLNSIPETFTSKDVFFSEVVSFTYKNVPADQVHEFISAKGDKSTGRDKEFSLASPNLKENEQEKSSSCCLL